MGRMPSVESRHEEWETTLPLRLSQRWSWPNLRRQMRCEAWHGNKATQRQQERAWACCQNGSAQLNGELPDVYFPTPALADCFLNSACHTHLQLELLFHRGRPFQDRSVPQGCPVNQRNQTTQIRAHYKQPRGGQMISEEITWIILKSVLISCQLKTNFSLLFRVNVAWLFRGLAVICFQRLKH